MANKTFCEYGSLSKKGGIFICSNMVKTSRKIGDISTMPDTAVKMPLQAIRVVQMRREFRGMVHILLPQWQMPCRGSGKQAAPREAKAQFPEAPRHR